MSRSPALKSSHEVSGIRGGHGICRSPIAAAGVGGWLRLCKIAGRVLRCTAAMTMSKGIAGIGDADGPGARHWRCWREISLADAGGTGLRLSCTATTRRPFWREVGYVRVAPLADLGRASAWRMSLYPPAKAPWPRSARIDRPNATFWRVLAIPRRLGRRTDFVAGDLRTAMGQACPDQRRDHFRYYVRGLPWPAVGRAMPLLVRGTR